MAEIIISLENGDQAREYNRPNELLQPHSYDQVTQFLESSLREVIKISDPLKEVPRVHDAIFINGARGTGKTAFILNLSTAFANRRTSKTKGVIHFCRPIDPTLLEEKDHFLNVVIGVLHAEVNDRIDRSEYQQDYFEAFEAVARALSSFSEAKELSGIEKILAHKSSIGLFSDLSIYYRRVCNVLKCDAVALLIDDVDMALNHAFQILDVIRRYLASPLIIPVVTGDLELYSHILTKHFHEELASEAGELDSADLTKQYLKKVLPTQRRTRLLKVSELLQQHNIRVEHLGETVLFQHIHAYIKHLTYRQTNGEEGSHPNFLPENTRELIQFLLRISPIIESVKELKNIPSSMDARAAEDHVRKLALDTARNKALCAGLLLVLNDYWASVENWAAFYRSQADLWLMNPPAGIPIQRPLQDIIWLNPLRHPKEHSSYPWNDEIERIFNQLHNPISQPVNNTLVSMPSLEPYSEDAIFAKADVSKLRSDRAKLLAAIYSHGDYYTSYQTANLIFFGRAWEIIVTSLLGSCTEDLLKNILYSPPYLSRFSAFPTKTLDAIVVNEDNLHAQATLNPDVIREFAAEIEKWRSRLTFLPPSAQLLYKATNKAFNLFAMLKIRRRMLGDSLGAISMRFLRITTNSFASFEKNILQGDGIVVRQNVALEANAYGYESDPSYSINVKPLLFENENSITRAIDQHPLFHWAFGDEARAQALALTAGSTRIRTQSSRPTATVPAQPSSRTVARRINDRLRPEINFLEAILKGEKSDDTARTKLLELISSIKVEQAINQGKHHITERKPEMFAILLQAATQIGVDGELREWLAS